MCPKRITNASTGSTPGYSDVQRSWCGSLGTTNILNDTVTLFISACNIK